MAKAIPVFPQQYQPPEEVMTLEEVAELLHVTMHTMYVMIRARRAPRGRKVGRRWLYLRSEVEDWLRAGAHGTEPRRLPPRRKAPAVTKRAATEPAVAPSAAKGRAAEEPDVS